jgi:predicted transcriptional regulator
MEIEEACALMSGHQIRRLPIVENDRVVGIVSLANLAIDLEEEEMLAETLQKISAPSRQHVT